MTEMAMKLPLKIATEPNDLVHRCKLFELVFKVETREVVLKSTLAPSCYRKKKKKKLSFKKATCPRCGNEHDHHPSSLPHHPLCPWLATQDCLGLRLSFYGFWFYCFCFNVLIV